MFGSQQTTNADSLRAAAAEAYQTEIKADARPGWREARYAATELGIVKQRSYAGPPAMEGPEALLSYAHELARERNRDERAIRDALAYRFRVQHAASLPWSEVANVLRGAMGAPQTPASTDDAPDEHGYVASPTDSAAYVPASGILAEHTPADMACTVREMSRMLDNFVETGVRWTRPIGKNGRPVPNRRSVHLGDWLRYLGQSRRADAGEWPRLSDNELEQRKAAVRATKHAGK